MNRTYALVWNPSLGAWSVADEHARRRGKGAGAVLAAALLLPIMASAADLPTGGQVMAGQGQIGTPANNQMVIDQASNKLAIDWQSFDIAAGNKVTFNQPGRDAIALNRVLGADGTKIMGQLDANGRVFIVNPNGVLFGQGAQVNVGGLVASTLDITNSDFEAGNYTFKGNGKNAAIVNNGKITATDGGSVALLGGTVSNNGVIVANQGSVALAAGNKVTLDFAGDGLLNVQVDEAVVDALVENHQLIKADGGQVLLTANAGEALINTVVNNTGTIEAQTVGEKDGKIVLFGSFDGGSVQVAGTLDASAPNGGKGGFIETSGAHVNVADSAKVTTQAADGKTGIWLIDPNDFTIAASDGNMTGTAVSAAVRSNNFEIQTATMGTAGGNGDIHVNDAITWNSGNTLTLTAERNINVNAAITAQHGSGKVALKYGQGSAVGGTVDYVINAPVNLQSGDNFSTQKGTTGAKTTYTVVNDATALQNMNNRRNGNYAVGSDIDLSSIANWAPVGTTSNGFNGRLSGLGHTLGNLIIDRSGTSDVGLFGYAASASVIRDIGLVGGSVMGDYNVGGLVGYNLGTISNAYATGNVNGNGNLYVGGLVGTNAGTISNAYATGSVNVYVNDNRYGYDNRGFGGLVGYNDGTISNAYATGNVNGSGKDNLGAGGLVGYNNGTISNVYATGNVNGYARVGGLVGEYASGTLSNAYATGSVNGIDDVAGLVGMIISGTISNAYATGNVHGNREVGGLVGYNHQGTIINAHWDSASTGRNNAVGAGGGNAIAITASNRYNTASYGNLGTWSLVDGTSNVYATTNGNWIMIAGQTRPFLASEYSTTIHNAHQLQLMTYNLGASYTLARDIDASATAGSNASGMWSTAGFVPTGDRSNAFRGRLDGQRHTISGLTIDRNSDYVGLFGMTVEGSAISNLGLLGGSVTGNYSVGGLVGYNGAWIYSAYATGNVNGYQSVGGLVGFNSKSIYIAYATGNVNGYQDVGGLVGYNAGGTASAYTTGNVTGDVYVGGLVGFNANFARIDDSYATGSVNRGATGRRGGLVGVDTSNGGVARSFYATTDANGVDINYGAAFSGNNRGTGKTWSELTQASTFAGWNLASTGGTTAAWRIYDGHSGPLLRSLLKPLTVTVADVAGKTYDGTSGTVAGVSHSLSDSSASLQGSASYTSVSTRNAGTYGLGLTGLYSGQQGYDIKVVEGSHVIAKASISSVTGITAQNRTYDGTTNAGLNYDSSGFSGRLGNDELSVASARGAFADKNAADGKSVSISNIVLGGADARNYSLTSTTATASASIAKASISAVTGITAENRTYDGTTDATLNTGSAGFTGRFGNDQLSVTSASGAFADKTAGNGKTVNVSNMVLGGADARNYTLASTTATVSANIAKVSISAVTGITAENRTYDGTTDATLNTDSAGLTGRVGTDELSVTSATGEFADKNAGNGKTVNVSNIVLGGADARNYSLTSTTATTSANIGKASISAVTGITAENRTYDGTAHATLNTDIASFTGRFDNDELSVASASGAFTDKNAGNDKTVNVSNMILTGADARNYTLASATTSVSANIAKASISAVTGISAQNRTYDGTTDVGLNYDSSGFSGRLGNDELSVASASGSFADKDAADGKTVSVSNIALGGADARNYSLTRTTATATANIAKASIGAVTGITAEDRTYDGTTDATLNTGSASFTGRFGNDELSVTSASGAFADKNAGNDKTVNVSNMVLTGADARNYTLASATTSVSANIAKASISAVTGISAQNRTYDGTTDAGLNYDSSGFSGRLGNDELSVASASGSFVDKNAADGKTVSVSNIVLGGADARNYSLTSTTATATANIAKASIGAVTGITAEDRTYDGTTDATLNTGSASFTGRFGNDELSVASASGAFTDKNAGNGKSVAITGIDLGGADAVNYTLANDSAITSASIAKASISAVTGITAQNRTYDGTTDAGLNYDSSGFSGRLGNDELSVASASGSFVDKNAADGKTVSVSNIVLGGADARNYSLTSTTATTSANIGKASISAVTGIAVENRTYDGTTDATLNTGSASFTGRFGNDELSVASASGAFTDKNAGNGKSVAITGIDLGGADAVNYTLANDSAITSASIAKASISAVTGITAQNRTYDGTTDASLNTGSAGFSGRLGNDQLSVSSAIGAFADKNAGNGKTVSVSNIVLGGAGADNYTLADNTAATSAEIAKASISTVTGISAQSRVYDGTTSASLDSVNARFTGIVAGDSLSVGSATGTFADSNAKAGKTVDISAITLAGADAGNYTLISDTSATTADIVKAALTITADNVSKVAGQSIALKGYTVRGLVGGDGVASVSLSSSGELSSAAAGVYAIVASDAIGSALDNYAIHYERGTLLVHSDQPYIGAMTSNGQTVSGEAVQQGSEPDGLSHELLITNPSDERLNLQVINQGIRLPEGI